MDLIRIILLAYVLYLVWQGSAGRLGIIAAVAVGATLLSGVGKTLFQLGDQLIHAVTSAL